MIATGKVLSLAMFLFSTTGLKINQLVLLSSKFNKLAPLSLLGFFVSFIFVAGAVICLLVCDKSWYSN